MNMRFAFGAAGLIAFTACSGAAPVVATPTVSPVAAFSVVPVPDWGDQPSFAKAR